MIVKNRTEWRQVVLDRDNYTCQRCKDKDNRLVAHHKWDRFAFSNLALKLSNGISYCYKCHRFIHRYIQGYQLRMFWYWGNSFQSNKDPWIYKLKRQKFDAAMKV